MVTEFNGHMFPTKRFDWKSASMNMCSPFTRFGCFADMLTPNIAGCIAWCLFDYNTHKDFGSGDRICYHGISDMFRIPKICCLCL